MRENMKCLEGVCSEFTATFVERGKHRVGRHMEPTLLFNDVRLAPGARHTTSVSDPNAILTDHLWVTEVEPFDRVNLQPGAVIAFTGKVRRYSKGNVIDVIEGRDREQDFSITQIEKPRVVRSARPDLNQYKQD